MIRNFRFYQETFSKEFLKDVIVIVSDLTFRELEQAPKVVKDFCQSLPARVVEKAVLSLEAEMLAQSYIK